MIWDKCSFQGNGFRYPKFHYNITNVAQETAKQVKVNRKAIIRNKLIKSHISSPKPRGKAHMQIDKRSRKTRTVNRMNTGSFPNRWSFSYSIWNLKGFSLPYPSLIRKRCPFTAGLTVREKVFRPTHDEAQPRTHDLKATSCSITKVL